MILIKSLIVNAWEKRTLIRYFAWMELKLRYKGSRLGLIWAALEPLFIFSILYVVMTAIRDVSRDEFAIYLIIGVLFYHLFSRGTVGGMQSIVTNGNILKSVKIEKELFPIISTGTIFLFMLVQLADLFILMPIFSFIPTWTIIFLVPLLMIFLILILGVSYLLAILNAYIRDTQQVWNVMIYALLFITPIFWYLEDVDGILLVIQQVNPLGQIIELAHKIVVFGEVPSLFEWLYTLAFVLIIFFVGYGLFKKYENNMVERL